MNSTCASEIVQFPGDGGAFFHQQQLLVMLLCLVKVQPAPGMVATASHQRRGTLSVSLCLQLTVRVSCIGTGRFCIGMLPDPVPSHSRQSSLVRSSR